MFHTVVYTLLTLLTNSSIQFFPPFTDEVMPKWLLLHSVGQDREVAQADG